MAENKYEIYGVRHCYIEYNNGGVIGYKRVWFTKESEIKAEAGKLEFSGDGQKFNRPYGYLCSGTVACEIDDDTIDSILWGLPVVTPGGGDDFAKRFYHGVDQELQTTYVGVRLTMDGANTDTGAPIVMRFRVLKAQFSPDSPPKMQTEAIGGRLLTFNAHRTTTDIVGGALTSMPTRGASWIRDFITNTANFDPVPGDIL